MPDIFFLRRITNTPPASKASPETAVSTKRTGKYSGIVPAACLGAEVTVPIPVIFDDIACVVACADDGDVTGTKVDSGVGVRVGVGVHAAAAVTDDVSVAFGVGVGFGVGFGVGVGLGFGAALGVGVGVASGCTPAAAVAEPKIFVVPIVL